MSEHFEIDFSITGSNNLILMMVISKSSSPMVGLIFFFYGSIFVAGRHGCTKFLYVVPHIQTVFNRKPVLKSDFLHYKPNIYSTCIKCAQIL